MSTPRRRISLRSAVDDVASRDPVLAHLVALAGPIKQRPRDPDGHFGALVRAIVYQQLAGRAAQAIHQRVRATVGDTLTPRRWPPCPTTRCEPQGCPPTSWHRYATCRPRSSTAA